MIEQRTPHLQKVHEINTAITARRTGFIDQYKTKKMGSPVLTYEPALDTEVYKVLKTFKDKDSSAYEHVKGELDGYTTFQVETFIGERLNALLSEFRYDVRGGVLYGQGRSDTLLEMIQLGKDCRDEVVKEVDKPRQAAEIEQFTKIQEVFGNKTTPVGTTIVSISPPGKEGSAYSHNFFDVFVLSKDDKTQEKYVAAHRFASELSSDEYKEKASHLVPGYFNEHTKEPLDSYFLSHPLILSTASEFAGSPEKIQSLFHKDHNFLSKEDFAVVRNAVAGMIVSYVNTLVDTPEDEQLIHLTLNAIMNKADGVADSLRRRGSKTLGDLPYKTPQHIVPPSPGLAMRDQIAHYGNQQVRKTPTGCGFSGGFGQDNGRVLGSSRTPSNMSQFRNSENMSGEDKYGKRTFDCPDCHKTNERPYNELLPTCQHCGSSKVAC